MSDNDHFYREQLYRELSEQHERNLKEDARARANMPPPPPGSGYAALGMICLPFGFAAAIALHVWLKLDLQMWTVGIAAGIFTSILLVALVYLGRGIAFTFRKTWKVQLALCALAAAYWLYWLHPDSFLTSVATRVLWLFGGLALVNWLHEMVARKSKWLAYPMSILLGFFVLMGSCVSVDSNPNKPSELKSSRSTGPKGQGKNK